MCDLSGGQCDVWEESNPRARKLHECYACGEAIAPGFKYHLTETLFDGHWSRWKHCARCSVIYKTLLRHAESDEYVEPGLDCGEVWEGPPPEIAALAFAIPSDFRADGEAG